MKLIFSNFDSLKNPDYSGGGAIVVHEIAKRLAREHLIVVFIGSYPGSRDYILDRVFYRHVGFSGFGPKVNQLLFQLLLIPKVLSETFMLWFESSTPPFTTSFLQLFSLRPIIALIQNLSGRDMSQKYHLPFFLIEKIGLKTYNYFIVLTPYFQKQIKLVNQHARVAIIPNGINARLSTGRSPIKNYFLFLGRIDIHQKGLDFLLEAYAKIQSKTAINLYIAGSGIREEERELKRLIREKKLTERVILLGKVIGNKKVRLIKEALFIVQPSRYEAHSLSLIEALYYHKVVLCFAMPSLSWLSPKLAYKIPNFDANKLAEKILFLSQNKMELRKREKKLRETHLIYTWDEIAQKYRDFIKTVAEEAEFKTAKKSLSV